VNYGIDLAQLIALGFAKASVLLFYRRIFGNFNSRIFEVVTVTLLALVFVWTAAFFFTNAFQYTPVSDMWTKVPSQAHSTFSQSTQMYLAQSYADVVLDVVIITVPIPMSTCYLHRDSMHKANNVT
jgi:hypothetical protein